jgi:DNA polymerase (family 10)
MGAKKEEQILKALEARKRHSGRHLLPHTHETAEAVVAYLRGHAPSASIEAVGSLRRGCESCGDIDILASGADASLMSVFTKYPLVERVLGLGDTKSSVQIKGDFQVDLRLVAADSRGAALHSRPEGAQHRPARSCDRPRFVKRGGLLASRRLKAAGVVPTGHLRARTQWIAPSSEARAKSRRRWRNPPRLVDQAICAAISHAYDYRR